MVPLIFANHPYVKRALTLFPSTYVDFRNNVFIKIHDIPFFRRSFWKKPKQNKLSTCLIFLRRKESASVRKYGVCSGRKFRKKKHRNWKPTQNRKNPIEQRKPSTRFQNNPS